MGHQVTRGLLLTVVTVAAVAGICVAEPLANMVRNGSFEQEDDGPPAGWQVAKGTSASLEQGDAPDGEHWLKLGRDEGGSHALAFQRVAMEPNTGYRLRAYLRAPRASYYCLVAYDAVLNTLSSTGTGWAVEPDWVELKLDFRTREEDRLVNVGLLGYGPEAHWDHVRMWKDDSVQVGDLSPTVNELPEPTQVEHERGFMVFSRCLEEFTSARYVPTRWNCLTPPMESCASGEAETILFMLYALRDLDDVSATIDVSSPAPGETRVHQAGPRRVQPLRPELLQVGYSRRQITGQSYIRYPLLLVPPHPVDVAAGDVLQYAVRVRVPQNYPFETATVPVRVRVGHEHTALVAVLVKVPEVRLEPAEASFFMYYSDSYLPAEVATARCQAAYYRDMAQHGMNSVTLYVVPEQKREDGTFGIHLHRDLRYNPQDPRYSLGISERIALMQAAGLTSPSRPLVLVSGGAKHYDWGCFRDSDSIRILLNCRKRLGWPPLLFYVHDEPNTEDRVRGVRQAFETIYASVAEARTVTAIGSYGIEHVGDLYDVWIASLSSIDESLIKRAQSAGKELWAYDCRHRGQRPDVDRFLCGLYAWRTGIRGLGQWAYYSRQKLQRSEGGSYDVPQKWDEWYMMASDDGPVATMGWEAKREGIEDYRCLTTLEKLVETSEGPDAERGRALLAEAREMTPVAAFVGAPRDWRYIWEFEPAPSLTPKRMHALRDEMIELIAALQHQPRAEHARGTQ